MDAEYTEPSDTDVLYGFALNVSSGEFISPNLWSGWAILNIAIRSPVES